jgi:hypothetical protein
MQASDVVYCAYLREWAARGAGHILVAHIKLQKRRILQQYARDKLCVIKRNDASSAAVYQDHQQQ